MIGLNDSLKKKNQELQQQADQRKKHLESHEKPRRGEAETMTRPADERGAKDLEE